MGHSWRSVASSLGSYDLDRVSKVQLTEHVDPAALFYAGTEHEDTIVTLRDENGRKPDGAVSAVAPCTA
jgi:hypothetical protein